MIMVIPVVVVIAVIVAVVSCYCCSSRCIRNNLAGAYNVFCLSVQI